MKKMTERQNNLFEFLKNNNGSFVFDSGYYNHNRVCLENSKRLDFDDFEKHNLRGCGECRTTLIGLEKRGFLKKIALDDRVRPNYKWVLTEKGEINGN